MKNFEIETIKMTALARPNSQGDLDYIKIKELPENLIKVAPADDGHYIVAHSETGHHHVLDSENVDLFQAANDPLSFWAVVKETTSLKHLRSFDTHAKHIIKKGIYWFGNQREWAPEGWKRAAD